MNPIVLVDFSNLVWACYYANPDKLEDILTFKLQYLSDTLATPIGRFVMVKDQSPKHKYELYPEYKAGRQKPPEDPRPRAEEIVRNRWKNRFLWSPDHEADDAIASAVARIDGPVTIVTSDKDLWQLISAKVSVFDPIKKKFIDLDDIVKAFEVENPAHIPVVKALWGDPSDNLPNLAPRMQKHLLPMIKSTDGNLVKILFWEERNDRTLRCRILLERNRDGIVRNYKLAKLLEDCKIEWD